MNVSVSFTDEEIERLSGRLHDGEQVEDAVHGIVLMVLDDLDAQERLEREWWAN